MSKIELYYLIEALNEWEAIISDAKAEADSIRDRIKAELIANDVEEMECGKYIIRYTSVLSTRLDTTALKKAMPDVFKAYTKQIASRRFSISA